MLKRLSSLFLNHRVSKFRPTSSYFSMSRGLSTADTTADRTGSFDNYLKSMIKLNGPLTVAHYMREALSNPVWVSRSDALKN